MSIIAAHLESYEDWKSFNLLYSNIPFYQQRIGYLRDYSLSLNFYDQELYRNQFLSYPNNEFKEYIHTLDEVSLSIGKNTLLLKIITPSKFKEILYINNQIHYIKDGKNEDDYHISIYYSNGSINMKGFNLFSRRVGEWIRYKIDGKIDNIEIYNHDGKLDEVTYYKDGRKY